MSEIDRLRKNVFDNLQEIERLNNIIDELNNKITKLELKELTYLDIINKMKLEKED